MTAAAVLAAGCHSQKPIVVQGNSGNNALSGAEILSVRLGSTSVRNTADSVGVSFTVSNNTDSPVRFCKWETPFEPRLGKYFEVSDDKGNEAAFKGAMARRVMPPPAEAYIVVAAHDSVNTSVNLAKNYSIQTGKYTVKYVGGGVSGLRSGNTISVSVAGTN
ncbi:protease [Mucilaginibacter celer]|uniref:Protease n=2 Tax=Mucilaginibacter celer TaxID=2305508 RepID=A0A494VS74_9SPHI|nr:protease [Mucilaginibacter celer]